MAASEDFRVLKSGDSVSDSQLLAKSVGIIISHVVDAVFTYGNKVTVQNIFHLKFQLNVENVNQFPKENVTKLLEKLKIIMQHQIKII